MSCLQNMNPESGLTSKKDSRFFFHCFINTTWQGCGSPAIQSLFLRGEIGVEAICRKDTFLTRRFSRLLSAARASRAQGGEPPRTAIHSDYGSDKYPFIKVKVSALFNELAAKGQLV